MIDNITDHQPALTIQTETAVHIISIVTIRQLAAGAEYRGDRQELIQLMAIALRDLIDDYNSI